jgi:hypothetical protein
VIANAAISILLIQFVWPNGIPVRMRLTKAFGGANLCGTVKFVPASEEVR